MAFNKKLINNDHQIILIGTGNKIEINAYEDLNSKQYKLNIDGFRGKNVFIKIKVLFQIITNIFYLIKVIKKERIDAMIGFGGFISVPAGIACFIKGIPVFTHEQNSVMGSANKLLSKFAMINFLGFKIPNINNSIFSGNPIRDTFRDYSKDITEELEDKIKVYITGGSQGSTYINLNMPHALEPLSEYLLIKHQCGLDNLEKVKSEYESRNIEAEVLEFRVLESSPIAGKSLKDVDFPKDSLAGLLKKEAEILVPRANTRFETGDVLTVFCLRDDINKVENLFQVGVDFF